MGQENRDLEPEANAEHLFLHVFDSAMLIAKQNMEFLCSCTPTCQILTPVNQQLATPVNPQCRKWTL